MTEEKLPEITSHPVLRRGFQVAGLLTILTFAGAIPFFHWTGNVKDYSQKQRTFMLLDSAAECGWNGGTVYNTNANGTLVNCSIWYNATGKSWQEGQVSLWFCLLHGGCW